MELKEILEKRRSIREYAEGGRLTADMVKDFVTAALEAPSWKNTQTARYHAVLSQDMILKIREKCFGSWNFRNTANVQALVVTAFVKDISGYRKDGTPDNELGNGWGIYDAGLQNSIFLLKAAEAGIDSLVMGIRDAALIRELLEIPENEEILSVIALGERAVTPEKPLRRQADDVLKIY